MQAEHPDTCLVLQPDIPCACRMQGGDWCCECRYIQVAELEQCWRGNDASFVVPDCDSEVCPVVKASDQKIRVQRKALLPCAI